MVEGDGADEVPTWLQRVSEPLGTAIEVKGYKGVIRV
jgi:hypothetical protein